MPIIPMGKEAPSAASLSMTVSAKAIVASALVILLGISVLSFQSILQEGEDREWVTHTHLVLEKIAAIRADITQAETGQRGYILTGKDMYLMPYEAATIAVQRDVNDLRNLTADNPKEAMAIERLDKLITARVAGLAARLQIRRESGLEAAAAAVETGNNGEQLMNDIRNVVDQMRHWELELLARRSEAADASGRRMKEVILFGNMAAFLILSVAGWMIYAETLQRNRVEGELKGANQQLSQQSMELSDTNRELESFSYSVAHDLRAPLRQIAGYSRVLMHDYSANLDAEACRYLEKVSEGATRMGRLVDDLLSFSKVGRQELVLQPTSLDKLMRQAVEELRLECVGRKIDWQIGELFTADCDPTLMKQVFVNLISNAVKYTRKKDRAVIQVGQKMENGERVVYVRDNGAGFEMQYVDKLFGVFQRLHKTRDFEGTGVGLAIVQRIIRKHGGRIWAEGVVGEGAVFFFTLRAPEDERESMPNDARNATQANQGGENREVVDVA